MTLFSRFLMPFFFCFSLFARGSQESTLSIYTYSGFASQEGAGRKIAEIFEQRYGKKIVFHTAGGAGLLLSRVQRQDYTDGLVLGLDNISTLRLSEKESAKLFLPLPDDQRVEKWRWSRYILPFDYSQVALVYNKNLLKNPPQNFQELIAPEYANKLILYNPLNSGIALAFLLAIEQKEGANFPHYLQKLRPNLLTVANDWSQAYALFLQGAAPLVLSTNTSQAYHEIEEGKDTPYRTVNFKEKAINYIEGAAILSQTQQQQTAQQFLQFLLEEEIQRIIYLYNVVLPVVNFELEEAYKEVLISPAGKLPQAGEEAQKVIQSIEKSWTDAFLS